jgi:hypothetical protein
MKLATGLCIEQEADLVYIQEDIPVSPLPVSFSNESAVHDQPGRVPAMDI